MAPYPSHLAQLIVFLKKFPGVGTKTAERFAFQLLEWPEDQLRLARGAFEGPARPRDGHGDAQLPALDEAGAGARDAGAVLAQDADPRRVRGRHAPHRSPERG